MNKSETILGRVRNRDAFRKRLHHNSKLTRMEWSFTVSAYRVSSGKLFYSDALREPHCIPSFRVVYRIRVTPKGTPYA